MHQSRLETLNQPPDDLRPVTKNQSGANLGASSRSLFAAAGTALLIMGLRRRSLPLLVLGGGLLYRGASGQPIADALDLPALRFGLQFEETITIHLPVEEVYGAWRRLENLPRIMTHLESVMPLNDRESHWVAKVPAPLRLEWDAAIVDEQENRKIAWGSLPGSRVNHGGAVFFHEVPKRNATEVKVIFSCMPPAGTVGAAVAKLFAKLTDHQLREDLRTFKAVLEAGERPNTTGQPSGRLLPRRGDVYEQL